MIKKNFSKVKIIETERFYLREMTVSDAENVYLLNLDHDVIKYTGDAPFKNVETAQLFLENYNHYQEYGLGRWAVIDNTNNNFLGWCGLKYTPQLEEYDIGFRFYKKYWNKGYATESAQACIDIGFKKFKLAIIVGRALQDNLGSIKVLEKIGLTFFKSVRAQGKTELIFRIKNKIK